MRGRDSITNNRTNAGMKEKEGLLTANTKKTSNIYTIKKNGPRTRFACLMVAKSKSPKVARNNVNLYIYIE